MSDDNVVSFPEGRSVFANIDAHLRRIDALLPLDEGSIGKLLKLAINGFGKLMDVNRDTTHSPNMADAVDGLLMSYLTLGTMLGADRDLMVKSLRHG